MQILSVVGARPQFVKLAPIAHECARHGVSHTIVHTGQHYDPLLSDVFFTELNIPAPDEHLGVGSGSHGVQTGAMLGKLDAILDKYQPDWVLVYGDTNSTLAAALSAVKLHYPIAHLEAGLRSFNRAMPEEHNRVLTDHAADLLLAPTTVAAEHLAHEGLAERTVVVGDVMTDVLLEELSELDPEHSPVAAELGLANDSYLLATIHRAENTDDPARLAAIISSLQAAPDPVVILAHPRLIAKCAEHGLTLEGGSLRVHEPLPYADLLASALHAKGIVTDSGGLQKEAFLMRVPCTTVRTETEWVETVELGWNVLAQPGEELARALARPRPAQTEATPYGSGDAARRVVSELISRAVV
ncbi:UDP-N-acetylglucosamine 2-epimerase (non-hydrolyzing) [Trueperella pecoris]|uniref:UDP-N-acetylglucosamine 2-epimerase (Non-hydrolyzing) n=1 Tax=Trueperella pecoris TaxID=2733571 RepID=A0A7M1QYY9_9ACTO|nr:UDP-N-acetylglucosamine 2-epimerase (non-hydrolyzing) [Trueperella pecoris]QOR47249.1 UDP-N-acetylglucosamine 2-epimerase (non-hydrolyzing) [Trueperella pecoris]